jgi:hypothetical protein
MLKLLPKKFGARKTSWEFYENTVLGFIRPSEFKSGIGFAQKIRVLEIPN